MTNRHGYLLALRERAGLSEIMNRATDGILANGARV
jgi:hypothetical protein